MPVICHSFPPLQTKAIILSWSDAGRYRRPLNYATSWLREGRPTPSDSATRRCTRLQGRSRDPLQRCTGQKGVSEVREGCEAQRGTSAKAEGTRTLPGTARGNGRLSLRGRRGPALGAGRVPEATNQTASLRVQTSRFPNLIPESDSRCDEILHPGLLGRCTSLIVFRCALFADCDRIFRSCSVRIHSDSFLQYFLRSILQEVFAGL